MVKHPGAIMTRRVDGCSVCDGIDNDIEERFSRHTLKEWEEGAKACFSCGLIVALLHDAKKKHGIDPSGGGQYKVSFGSRSGDMLGRYFLMGYTPPDDVTDIEDKIRNEITFYNPISKFDSFLLPLCHDN